MVAEDDGFVSVEAVPMDGVPQVLPGPDLQAPEPPWTLQAPDLQMVVAHFLLASGQPDPVERPRRRPPRKAPGTELEPGRRNGAAIRIGQARHLLFDAPEQAAPIQDPLAEGLVDDARTRQSRFLFGDDRRQGAWFDSFKDRSEPWRGGLLGTRIDHGSWGGLRPGRRREKPVQDELLCATEAPSGGVRRFVHGFPRIRRFGRGRRTGSFRRPPRVSASPDSPAAPEGRDRPPDAAPRRRTGPKGRWDRGRPPVPRQTSPE